MMRKIIAVAKVVLLEMYRRKDFYVLFILTALITALMGSMTFFNDNTVVRYLKEICLLLIWISSLVLAIGSAARQIPAERENRTIFPLLAKPITRSQLLVGKFFGCWIACGLAVLVLYLFFGLIAASREHSWPVGNYLQAFVLHWFMLAILIAFVLFGSLVFAAPSSNATITFVLTLAILVLGRHLNKIALKMSEPGQSIVYAIYYGIPHLELFDVRDLIIHEWPLIKWSVIGIAVLYAAVYSAIFLYVGSVVFRRKALTTQ
jgi:Cu-processing system permease protein